MLPIIIDDTPLPSVLRAWLVLRRPGRTAIEVAGEVAITISDVQSMRHRQEMRIREVEDDLSKFVDGTIETQIKVGSTNRNAAYLCYALGASALGIGVIMTIDALTRANALATPLETGRMISAGLANLVVIGFLGAFAKYGYSLGKSFMTESLKSSDRIHAIQFGQFYLKAFGSRLSPGEVREAFQHWNIDRGSTFATLNSSETDPQIVSLAAQVAAAVMGKKDEK